MIAIRTANFRMDHVTSNVMHRFFSSEKPNSRAIKYFR